MGWGGLGGGGGSHKMMQPGTLFFGFETSENGLREIIRFCGHVSRF